ncbi:MAG TPA: hypothetical protein VG122_10790 [Gemmata sp.]|nr:hypothetical protein [Gemmata sp.]
MSQSFGGISDMAIEFNCPHCQHFYRLNDTFAGKRATCKNPDCRQVITIPKPVTVPEDHPMRSAAELEAAALSALSDESPKEQEKNSTEKVIAMTCTFCEHKWTEPFSKAGKNTLCPNPECRQRLKIPEPKTDEPVDWRQTKTKLPSGAKQNFEKLEGVEDAAEAKIVSGTALREADATGIEIEPRSLKEKMLIGLTIFGLLFAVGFGIWYLMRSRTSGQEDQLLVEARKEFDETAKELPTNEAGLCSAVLNAAAAEYALRQNTTEKLKEAHSLFGKARDDLRKQAPVPERNAVGAELALAVVAFGGSDEQVKEQLRYRWQPDISTGKLKINEQSQTVHDELRQVLGLLLSADFEFRVGVARRLTRELFKKGQGGLAADIIPLALFNDAGQDEGRAVVALEILRLDKGSDIARRIAGELKTKIADELNPKGDNPGGLKGNPFPASAHTLIVVVLGEKGFVSAPPKTGAINSDAVRVANVGIALLEGNTDEAMKLALREGMPESQLKALVLCAEWMASPAPALEEAQKIIASAKGRREVSLSQSQILRLSQIAATAGWAEQAKTFANALTDESLKAWATGDAVHLRLVTNPKDKADEAAVEVPEDQKKVKVGHAWGMFWIARRNAMISGDRTGEKKATTVWPSQIHPFALAGIALGLQDR